MKKDITRHSLSVKVIAVMAILFSGILIAHTEPSSNLAATFPKMVGKPKEKLYGDHTKLLTEFFKKDKAVPWHVWHFKNTAKEDRYVLFSGKPLQQIPGKSGAVVRLFSANGKQLGIWSISTGWRIDIKSAEFRYDKNLQAPTIIINTAPSINGRNIAKQFFAFHDNILYFVRAENGTGQLIRNNYMVPNWTLGYNVSNRKKNQWLEDLKSDSMVTQLAALTYIGGVHMNPNKPSHENYHSESVEEANIAKEVRSDPSAKEIIKRLAQNESDWLREAAEIASKPEVRNGHRHAPPLRKKSQ